MATLTLTISKLRFPGNANISNPITVTLEYKEYYADSFTLIDTNVNVDVDGTILDSPLPTITVDPSLKYVIKCTNELCEFQYEQSVIINPYCPNPYTISDDQTYCYIEEVTDAIPPSTPGVNSVAVTDAAYSICGSWIYNEGFNINGTGSNTQISLSNLFWVNGPGDCFTGGNTTDGPLNRTGLWVPSPQPGQKIGFSVCVDLQESKTYYVGIGSDNYGSIIIDGNIVLEQDAAAMDMQFFGFVIFDGQSPYRAWNIYPINILSGVHVIELLGNNSLAPLPGNFASIGAEMYDNTPAEIAAATDYSMLNVVFTTSDFIGQPVQIGTEGVGYTCPDGFSLQTCSSPFVCRRLITTPILY